MSQCTCSRPWPRGTCPRRTRDRQRPSPASRSWGCCWRTRGSRECSLCHTGCRSTSPCRRVRVICRNRWTAQRCCERCSSRIEFCCWHYIIILLLYHYYIIYYYIFYRLTLFWSKGQIWEDKIFEDQVLVDKEAD